MPSAPVSLTGLEARLTKRIRLPSASEPVRGPFCERTSHVGSHGLEGSFGNTAYLGIILLHAKLAESLVRFSEKAENSYCS